MSGFILFFPDRTDIATVERIPVNCGLTDVLDGGAITYGVIHEHGPDGKAGSIVSVRPANGDGSAAECQYKPDVQTWVRCVDKTTRVATHWLGFENAHRPRPADLIRPQTLDGSPVMLGGQTWTVPVILAGKSTLPRAFKMVEGELLMIVRSEYDGLRERCERLFNAYALNDGDPITFSDLFNFAVDCLKVNYRVGRYEVCALELLDTDSVLKVLEAAFGFDLYRDEQEASKKNGTPTGG